MGLRDIEATLPPGFKFYPSDEELVCHYLYKKIANERASKGTLVEIDLHTCEPWQLPDVAKLGNKEWYFFSFRDRKYATGLRTNRATTSGYWKATGKDRMIFDPTTQDIVGMRKTLVFYLNRAPQGIKTGWVMHEFRLENPHMPPKEDWVLCRVMNKSKGQPSTEFMLENVLETTMGLSSPTLASSSPTDQTRPTGFQQLSSFYQVSEHCNNPTLNPNVLEYSQQGNSTPIVDINSKGGDEYGFLLNMSFDDNNLEDGGPAMKFEDDSSIVFF